MNFKRHKRVRFSTNPKKQNTKNLELFWQINPCLERCPNSRRLVSIVSEIISLQKGFGQMDTDKVSLYRDVCVHLTVSKFCFFLPFANSNKLIQYNPITPVMCGLSGFKIFCESAHLPCVDEEGLSNNCRLIIHVQTKL